MNLNFTLYIFLTLVIIFILMILAWFTSSRINSKDYGGAAMYNQWVIFISGLSFVILLLFGGYLIYQSRKEITRVISTATKKVAKTAGAGLQKIAE